MASQATGEFSTGKERPENVKICRSMEEFGEGIQTATLKDNNVLIVICFVAKWSDKCKNMEAFINELAEKDKGVVFITADIDDMQALSWNWEVVSVPTYVLLKREYMVDVVYGYSKKGLVDTISKWKALNVYERRTNRQIRRQNPNEPVEDTGFLFNES